MGVTTFSPYEMLEILPNANGEYVGNRAIDLSGARSGDIATRCIYATSAMFYDGRIGGRDGDAPMHLKASREQAIREKFESPKYVARRSSNIRRDFSTMDRLASESLSQALGESVSMETNPKRQCQHEMMSMSRLGETCIGGGPFFGANGSRVEMRERCSSRGKWADGRCIESI